MKTCTKCGETKAVDAFYLDRGERRAACAACVRAHVAAHRAANRDAIAARDRERYRADPSAKRAAAKRWYEANLDVARAARQSWGAAHPTTYAQRKRWMLRNPAKAKARRAIDHARWRARMRVVGNLRADDVLAVREACDDRCAYCFGPADPVTIDHVTAVARGGTHDVTNLVVACVRCNSMKGARGVLFMLNRCASASRTA